ncbi:MAG: HAMP domain-containing histidine kinase [Sulfurovum sp.]|nr:HAMP domain-containing histidine kinase [Sulfurovum sp.]
MRLLQEDMIQFSVDVLFFVVAVWGYYKLKKNPHTYMLVTRIVFFFALFAALSLLYDHEDIATRFIWFSTIIYMIFYLFNRIEAFYWIGSIGMVLIVFYLYDTEKFSLSLPEFLVWLLNMLIVIMISYWYAKMEEDSTNKLLSMQNRLSEEVQKKTQELKQRTEELELLNLNLEARIREEVEKNRKQEELLHKQARYVEVGETLSMIAHQWRQPLNAISSNISLMQVMLKSGKCDVEIFSKKTKRVADYVQHLSGTIDDFRYFFREDQERSYLTMNTIVEEALGLIMPMLHDEKISVEVEDRCNCDIYSYRNEILHVVLNLLTNARDALMGQPFDKRYIKIRMGHEKTHVFLEIEDSGGGVNEEIIEKIFDPYFTTKGEQGTGLGLYMSKMIIERHCQGSMEVQHGQKGAIFRLSFPIVK